MIFVLDYVITIEKNAHPILATSNLANWYVWVHDREPPVSALIFHTECLSDLTDAGDPWAPKANLTAKFRDHFATPSSRCKSLDHWKSLHFALTWLRIQYDWHMCVTRSSHLLSWTYMIYDANESKFLQRTCQGFSLRSLSDIYNRTCQSLKIKGILYLQLLISPSQISEDRIPARPIYLSVHLSLQ